MKFTVEKADLLDVLNVVSKAVSQKTNLDILKGIYMETSGDTIVLKSNDLTLAIEASLPAFIESEGKTVIEARLLNEIVRKMPNKAITFELTDRYMDLRCDRSEFKLQSFDADEFPEIPKVSTNVEVVLNQNILTNMIRMTNFAVSKDETRPILTGSLFEIKDKKAVMVSIDLYRIALKKSHVETDFNGRVVIPGRTLSEIQKIIGSGIEKEIVVKVTDKYISFEYDNISIVSKILEGEYIKYEQIIGEEFNTSVVINNEEFINAIDRASLMARESKSHTIKLSFSENQVVITSNSEIGSVEEKVRCRMDGKDLEIGFNPRYLIEALKVIDTEEVEMKLTTSVRPCIIKPYNDENYIYFVIPVRMSS